MKYLLTFIQMNLLTLSLEVSSIAKYKALLKIAALFSIPAWAISKVTQWSLTNQDYIAGVLACIAIDHLIGSTYHAFKVRDFIFKKNAIGLISKLTLCAGAAILFEVIQFTLTDIPFIYEYLKTVTRLMIIMYPAGSAFMNMSRLTNGKFPPIGWLKKLTAFNENLDLEKFSKNGSANITTNSAPAPGSPAGSLEHL